MAAKWTRITGASEGLGVEFARIAAAEGRDLILVARQAAKMERLAEDLRARHPIAVEVWPADLGNPEAVETLWRKAALRRHIEIVVNNAGLGANGPFAGRDFDREMSSVMVNVAALTIRKFKKDKLTLAQLVKYNSISPEGAEVLDSACRMAGYLLRHRGKLLFLLPGVPPQLEILLADKVIPALQAASAEHTLPVCQRVYRTCGLREVEINKRLLDLEADERDLIENIMARISLAAQI